MTVLTDLTVAEIRDGVRDGSFSAREVAEAFNAAVAAAKPLNAFIVETPEKALEAADAVDAARAKGEPLRRIASLVPAMLWLMFAQSAGELAGVLSGAGDSPHRLH